MDRDSSGNLKKGQTYVLLPQIDHLLPNWPARPPDMHAPLDKSLNEPLRTHTTLIATLSHDPHMITHQYHTLHISVTIKNQR